MTSRWKEDVIASFDPKKMVEASVFKGAKEFTRMLVDVCANAAAVIFRNVDLAPINDGDEVELNIWLPRISAGGEFHLSTPGQAGTVLTELKRTPTRIVRY